MSRFGDIAGDLVPNLLCAFSESGSQFVDFGNSVRDGLLGTNSDPDGTAAGYESVIQRGLCGLGDPPERIDFDSPPEVIPGSCNAQYRLRAFVTYLPAAGGDERTELFGENDPNVYTGPLGDAFVTGNSGERSFIRFTNINGFILGPFFRGPQPTFTLALERVDGEPDNCGSDGNPIDGPAPTTPSGTGDVTYQNEDGNQVTEPYDFTFRPPILSPGGDLIVPVEICLGPICIEICYNVSTGDVQSCQLPEPNDPCCPEVSPSTDLPFMDEPPPPLTGERYAGVLVRATGMEVNNTATELGGNTGLSLFIPRLAVVRFAVEIAGRRTWTVDQPVKTPVQGVFVNAPAFAYAWDIIEEPGITITAQGIVAPNAVS